jgi:hypothetical protein
VRYALVENSFQESLDAYFKIHNGTFDKSAEPTIIELLEHNLQKDFITEEYSKNNIKDIMVGEKFVLIKLNDGSEMEYNISKEVINRIKRCGQKNKS